MEAEIELNQQKIAYELTTSPRARYLRLSVGAGGKLTVILPEKMGLDAVENFMRKKSSWILSKIKLMEKFKPSLLPKINRKEFFRLKRQAKNLVKQRLDYFNNIYNFSYGRISIRAQKSRWGSCSKKGNLNFNYRVVFLPTPLLDYLIVHELCHTKEFNHSQKFWQLVGQTIPEYKNLRKELKNL